MEGVINRYAYTISALPHAKSSAELYLVADVIFCNQTLKLLYHLTGTFDVAGASDTNCYFKHYNLLSI